MNSITMVASCSVLFAASAVATVPTRAHAATTTTDRSQMTTARVVSVKELGNGQEKLSLSDGQSVLAPKGTGKLAKAAAAKYSKSVQPLDTVYGNCGSSYITIGYYSDGYIYQMNTGFTVIGDVIQYDWNANISGPESYVYHYHSAGTNGLDKTWHGQHHSTGHPSGRWSAGVISDESWAMLWDGEICSSGGPYSIHIL